MTSVRTEKNEQKQAEKIAMIKESIDKINSKSSNYSMQITVGMLNKPYKLGGLGFYKEVALESWLEMKAEIEIFYKNHFAEKMTTFEKARENNQKALKKLKDAKIK
jgi:phenolic acid decarboxylase